MKSFIKISALLGIVTFLIAPPATARGIIADDESTLPQEELAQPTEEQSVSNIPDAELQPEETLEVASEEVASEIVDVASAENTENNTENNEGGEDTFETASVVSTEDLEENRGAFSPVNTSYLMATSSNNSVTNSVTGDNVIADGAFNNSSGLVNIIQNSGNNVLIQSSTIVNVEMNQ